MAYKLSTRSKSNMKGVIPILKTIIEDSIAGSPFDFGIPSTGGVRTTKKQQELYAIGRTKASREKGEKPVTYVDGVNKKSRHQKKEDGFGHAVDIYIYDHTTKKASWNVSKLSTVAKHIKKVAAKHGVTLTWGGDWKWKDYPHFQI